MLERVLSYIDNQRGEPSLRVGKNKILSLEAVNKTPIISRKLNTMKGKIDKVPPSVNSRRDRLIRLVPVLFILQKRSWHGPNNSRSSQKLQLICHPYFSFYSVIVFPLHSVIQNFELRYQGRILNTSRHISNFFFLRKSTHCKANYFFFHLLVVIICLLYILSWRYCLKSQICLCIIGFQSVLPEILKLSKNTRLSNWQTPMFAIHKKIPREAHELIFYHLSLLNTCTP